MPASPGILRRLKCTSSTVQEHLAGVRDQGAGERLDQGGLAGAVVADHRQHLARVEVEVDAVQADHPTEGLDQDCGQRARSRSGRPVTGGPAVRLG